MALDITQLTSNVSVTDGVVSGDGIFDDLMETVSKNIEAQYDKGWITGSDYSRVYLGALQSTLNTATQIYLKQEGINQQLAYNDLSNPKKLTLLDKQILKADSDKALVDMQTTKLDESVLYNNKIHAMGELGNTIGSAWAGSIQIDSSLVQVYFDMIAELSNTTAVTVPIDPASQI